MLYFEWSPPIISMSSSPFNQHLRIVPYAPVTVLPSASCSIVFSFLAKSAYLSLFSISVIFTLWSARTVKFNIHQVHFLLLTITRSGRHAEITGSVWISKSQRRLCVYFFKTDSGLCIYYLFVWSNFSFLHNSQWITLPTRGVMVKAMSCGIVVREFVLQSRYYIHFRANTLGKGMNPLILPPAMGK